MIGDVFLGFFNGFIQMIGNMFSEGDFTINYNTLGTTVQYIKMALWFLPVTDILAILGIKVILINYMSLIRLYYFLKNLVLK